MADSNVTLVGNLTRDPELRYTPSGVASATAGLAVNRRFQKDGEWTEQTSFFNLVIWRDLAENVASSLGKGDRIVVTGRLEQRTWETADGDKRSTVEVVVDDIGPSLRFATAEIQKLTKREFAGAGARRNGSADDVEEEPF